MKLPEITLTLYKANNGFVLDVETANSRQPPIQDTMNQYLAGLKGLMNDDESEEWKKLKDNQEFDADAILDKIQAEQNKDPLSCIDGTHVYTDIEQVITFIERIFHKEE